MMKTRKIAAAICIVLVIAMVATLLLSAIGGVFAVSQWEIDNLKKQQEEVAGKRKELSNQISELQDEKETMLAKKAALDEQNELARQEIELINEQIALYEQLVEQKALELEEAIATEQAQKEALRVRMRHMEEASSLSYIAILFKATSFTDLLARIDSINAIMDYDKKLENAYIATRENVEIVKAEYEATLKDCEEKKVELEAKKALLEQEIEKATQLIIELEADIEKYKEEFALQEAAEAALDKQIKDMLAELERQQREAAINYIQGTGTFKWPLPGRYVTPEENTYGWRIHPIFGDNRWHAGTDIGAPNGTSILAADSGTVAIATYSSSYGNYVLISHGNGMSTLYAHMSSMAVSAGQGVTQGQVIGYVGSTGWSTGPHLHFEVRVNGNNTDPLSYTYF